MTDSQKPPFASPSSAQTRPPRRRPGGVTILSNGRCFHQSGVAPLILGHWDLRLGIWHWAWGLRTQPLSFRYEDRT